MKLCRISFEFALILTLFFFPFSRATGQDYAIAHVPGISPSSQISGNLMNDRCMLTVGESENVSDTVNVFHQWLMTRGQLSELGRMTVDFAGDIPDFSFERMIWVTGLNNRGRLIGNGVLRTVTPNQISQHAYGLEWARGVLSTLPNPSNDETFVPFGMNDYGVMVGSTETIDFSRSHPVMFIGKRFVDLTATGLSSAIGINNSMTIFGAKQDPNDPNHWIPAVKPLRRPLRTLPEYPGADFTQAQGMNDSEVLIGTAHFLGKTTKEPYHFKGIVWRNFKSFVDLGDDAWPTSINREGQVVGTIYPPLGTGGESGAFIWDASRGMRNLDTLLPNEYVGVLHVREASSINNLGQILVFISSNDLFNPHPLRGAAILYPTSSGYPCAVGDGPNL